jgi:hypothetical protein
MKPRTGDVKIEMLIKGEELAQLKRHAWLMAESFGLDSRIERYQGKRSIRFYRWDMDCLIDVVSIALTDSKKYPSRKGRGYIALQRLHGRLKEEYQRTFE